MIFNKLKRAVPSRPSPEVFCYHARPGSVLIVVLMVLSLMAISIAQLIQSTRIGSIFIKTMVDREHAKALAFGGINIAIAQLTVGLDAEIKASKQNQAPAKVEPEEENEFGKEPESITKKFINHLLANLNRWQVFDLTEKNDGMRGTIKICISSEHGKINLNEAFDFKKQEFKKEYEQLLKALTIQGKILDGEFYKQLLEFLKKRSKKLSDISELMAIPSLKDLDVFYHPPQLSVKGKASTPNRDLYLFDIFTTWTDDAKIDPLVFSDALCAIFKMNRPRADDAKNMKEIFKQLALAFKKDLGKNWDENWKVLEPLYGEKPKVLSEYKDILAKKFSSKVYSVLSYGKFNNIEQRVLAIVKEVEDKPKQDAKNNSTQNPASNKPAKRYFKIMRLYWL